MTALTPEQRAFVTAAARNAGHATAIVQSLRNLSGAEALAALTTALTAIIEANLAAEQRLSCLNSLLAPTIKGWANEAAVAEASEATIQ